MQIIQKNKNKVQNTFGYLLELFIPVKANVALHSYSAPNLLVHPFITSFLSLHSPHSNRTHIYYLYNIYLPFESRHPSKPTLVHKHVNGFSSSEV